MFVVVFAQNTQAGLMGPGWYRRAEPQPVVTSWIFPEEMHALVPETGPPGREKAQEKPCRGQRGQLWTYLRDEGFPDSWPPGGPF